MNCMKQINKKKESTMTPGFSIWVKEGRCYISLKEKTGERVAWCFLRGGENRDDDLDFIYLQLEVPARLQMEMSQRYHDGLTAI